MAVNQNRKNRKGNSILTKIGKTRLGTLNITQLTKLLESSAKPKDKDKIPRALTKLTIASA
jgi:hypothetical protein